MKQQKVVILGGGIAGMSAAHELVERGFAVEVLECKAIAGGKARSLPASGVSLGGPFDASGAVQSALPPLPGEHGFRFFPGFYRHVVHTMQRIPYRGRSVADNLVNAREVSLAAFDRAPIALPARFPLSGPDLQLGVLAAIAVLCGQLGVSLADGQFFANKIWQFMSSCEERRNIEYERTSWWDFIEADARSEAYRTYFAHGITRSLVAAQARRASAKTIGDIFLQLTFDIGMPSATSADRLLNGPTNDVWIDPWLEYLQDRGVVYRRNTRVTGLHTAGGNVQRVQVSESGSSRSVSGDYFIAALPVERMLELLDPELLALDPSLANLHALSRCVEWMNGIQFYLTESLPLAHGHVVYVDSPWALTSV